MRDVTTHKKWTLTELTKGLDLTVKGDSDCLIEGVATIQDAGPAQIAFLMNPLYQKFLPKTRAAAVILSPDYAVDCPVTALITTNPYFVYAKIAAYFDDKPKRVSGIHPSAVIGKSCEIAHSVSIGPNCVIGDHVKIDENVVIGPGCVIDEWVEIGAGTEIQANVTLYHRVKVGKNVLIASGTVIGSDGFGLAKQRGKWHKVPQLGTVIIGDDVEIGANCAIDRGAIDNTIIGNGVKLDNLIQVGHNVQIGENTAIAGCVGIAGSANIGKDCMIGGGTGVGGHITITDNVAITGMTAVSKSIRQPGVYSSGVGGVIDNKEWRKASARVHRLEQLIERIKILEEKCRVD
jgi:UDP-3-O-[3-hydroxymyristoyl] glucosamine N-acyltransferase